MMTISIQNIRTLINSHTVDETDIVFYAAIALLPVDGLKIGLTMPFWNPISPVLFGLYVALNWKIAQSSMYRFRLWCLLPAMLIVTSVYGWCTIAFHPVSAVMSLVAIALGLCCLLSLDIAIRVKRLSVASLITVLIVAYWCALAIGIIEYLSIKLHIVLLHSWLMSIMQRNYVSQRVQFLFAEPSYIGMHVYGILLPVYWKTHNKRLAILIGCFAAGSIIMGAGTRIVVDTAVAAIISLIIMVPWRTLDKKTMKKLLIAASALLMIFMIFQFVFNSRLHAIWKQGLWQGDSSVLARMFRTLSPLLAGWHDPAHLWLGFGAGNLADSMHAGYPYALRIFTAHNGLMTGEITGLQHVSSSNAFSMNFYVSIVAEFGLIALLTLLISVIYWMTRNHQWSSLNVGWLILLIYLYAQFEAYAFYALPLFIWTMSWNSHDSPHE